MWRLNIISIFIIVNKLIIFPIKCEYDFDTCPFVKANYVVTCGNLKSPLIFFKNKLGKLVIGR
jgi:hypothetical protein